MRNTILLWTMLIALSAFCGAQYHDPVYLFGGYPPNTGWNQTGLNLMDATKLPPTVTKVIQPDSMTGSASMDWDNKHLVLGVHGTTSTQYGPLQSGLFQCDTSGAVLKTYYYCKPSTLGYDSFASTVIDHNGDYVAVVGHHRPQSKPPVSHTAIWKIRPDGVASTLLTSIQAGLGQGWRISRSLIDVDSGKLLVEDSWFGRVYAVDTETGAFSTWGAISLVGMFTFPISQNHRNGYIQFIVGGQVYQCRPGTGGFSTLRRLSGWAGSHGDFDLQTAARPRLITTSVNGLRSHLYHVDSTNWAVTSVASVYPAVAPWTKLAFVRGRHIQTVRTAPDVWDIRLSVPHHPGKGYVLVAGASGVRPGIGLADGRNINLNWDLVFFMSLANLLKPHFDPGPLKLDANGEAKAKLDIRALGRPATGWGMPLWFAMAVLDAQAPGGIAYLPDTYVMRL